MEDIFQNKGGFVRMASDAVRIIQHSEDLHACDELGFESLYRYVCGGIF
jgi:hypothetical protein